MANVMDMLTKLGYEAASIGNDVLPCTLSREGKPGGFLMEDFSVQLLPEHEERREGINKAINFALDNQGLDTVQNEFQLSQYKDIVLTSDYDFDAQAPIYNVYKLDADKNMAILDSTSDRAAATKYFASRSGLVEGNIPTPSHEINRIDRFMEVIRKLGYSLADAVEDAFRAYDITDSDGHVVGYIGKNNRVTITSDNLKVKRTLTNAYIEANSDRVMLPGFFEKLKERLKEIGLALKVIFTRNGRHYAIQNDQHQEVATVDEDSRTVTYTDYATKEQMAKIDAMVEEIKRENLTREQDWQQLQEAQREESEREANPVSTRSESSEQPAFTDEDVQAIVGAVLANPALTVQLVSAVLTNEEARSRLNPELSQRLSVFQSPEKSPAAEISSDTRPARDEFSENISKDFYQQYSLLQTLEGFNQEQYNNVQNLLTVQYGTADPAVFEEKLQRGDYKEPVNLTEKLKASHEKAERQNAVTHREQPTTQKEQTMEKERA